MQLFRDLDARPPPCAAVAIGNFDGVHLGHQALLQRAVALANRTGNGGAAAAISFEPLPIELLRPEQAPVRIQSTRERIVSLGENGIDVLWLARFNRRLAAMSPVQFVTRFLVEGLGVQDVVVGGDFRYGARRAGDIDSLRAAGRAHGFEVHVQPEVCHGGRRVSSSRVREALRAGELGLAQALLGRRYSLSGRVLPGERLGRRLGFPTANLAMTRRDCPLRGIFAVRSRVQGETGLRDGVASLGYRPTVGGNALLLEVHLFDFEGDLYGRRLEVIFVTRLREEAHFDNLESMIEQMHRDAERARQILSPEYS